MLFERKSKGVDTWAKEPKYVDLHNMIYECKILSRIARPKFISLRNVVTIELRRNFNNKNTSSSLFICFRCDYDKIILKNKCHIAKYPGLTL